MMACELRLRPVGACALHGMDAFGVAKLALKDAERILELFPYHTEGFLRSAFAYYLLEDYQKAADICLDGIGWNFENTCLQVSPSYWSYFTASSGVFQISPSSTFRDCFGKVCS